MAIGGRGEGGMKKMEDRMGTGDENRCKEKR
jgi:hypothetical protein